MSAAACSTPACVSVSVVSHGHGPLLSALLHDLAQCASPWIAEVIVTLNIPEVADWTPPALPYPLRVMRNLQPQGFAANHNAAAQQACGAALAIMNPDLRLSEDPFGPLLHALAEPGMGLVAPAIESEDGALAPSARRLYTPWEIVSRCWRRSACAEAPDWLAGMFLLVRRDAFSQIGGFDARYFLYIEDVDFSTRLRLAGWRLACVSAVRVRHAAQYASHRSWRHLRWHLAGMWRYWRSPGFWRLWWRRQRAG